MFRKYKERIRHEYLREIIEKFEELYDDYYGQGEFKSANLVTDMVAYLQDDTEAISSNDKGL